MAVTITFEDRGLEDLRERLRTLRRHTLTIGFQGADGRQRYATGITVATVAAIQEFGTGANSVHAGIPARSFLRSTLFEQRTRIETSMALAVQAVVDGRLGPIAALSNAGRVIAGLVETKIQNSLSWAKHNAQATIEKKGFDYPLHAGTDNGIEKLSRSVSWAVRRGSDRGQILAQGRS